MNKKVFKGVDFILEIEDKRYTARHTDGAFTVSDEYLPSKYNILVAEENGLKIVLNITRMVYYVVNTEDIVVSMPRYTLKTLDSAVQFSKSYTFRTACENRLPLTQFFRDAKNGMKLKRTYSFRRDNCIDTDYLTIQKVQSNGLYLLREEKLSWLEVPNSKRIDYNGSRLSIYTSCYRLLNESEKHILDLWESMRDIKAEECDLQTDSNSQYWRKKAFFEQQGYDYLFTVVAKGPLRYSQSLYLVIDKRERGNIIVEYDVILKENNQI